MSDYVTVIGDSKNIGELYIIRGWKHVPSNTECYFCKLSVCCCLVLVAKKIKDSEPYLVCGKCYGTIKKIDISFMELQTLYIH